ncbi:DUF885 domain-containing protein [Alterisphingorhabdus coralli]|uniref:DUF885 domain-containing protein n=1 Tax=Alterisphingorhabdus coralli TaxID=3071408 RepID=A0AA97F9B9_9SPHN|nr:DUF885 domain-containing protein [Parasphingorhabdus sp. SCSIO 66989]WOE74860.1 DUF885 domain-containing protein [Parasphingorhabdus sp. SCSIO 66989]
MRMTMLLATSTIALAVSAPGSAFANTAAPEAIAAADAMIDSHEDQTEGEKLRAIFSADDQANLKRNPLFALFRGDMRYADQFGDYISDAYNEAEKKAAEDNLAALAAIDTTKLNSVDAIAYQVFKRNQESSLKGYSDEILPLTIVRPLNHFSGFHTFYPTFASGKGAAPFKTVTDYENNLKRHRGFIRLMDASIERFKQGEESGVFETKLTIRNVIEQLDTQLAQAPEESPYYGPINSFPEDFSEADKERLTAEYRDIITKGIYPVYTRMRDYLRDDYLPQARDGVGLSYMKGGDRMYQHLLEQTTTLPLTANEIHELGLSEVARITTEMEAIKNEVAFDGTLKEFFDFIRTDPQFKPESREALTQAYYDLGKKVDAVIETQFKVIPKTPLEIRPYEPFREKFQAGGSYQSGTPDGSRPGIFYFNAYDLPSRTTPGQTTLYLHEGAPGHHFQISLAQENDDLPAFMRFGGNTAYVEGWALYSEKLGFPMGLFDDPYQRLGHLDDEMLRAMRLVVDTGLHSKGWTREQAIQYMLDNSSMGETDATAEVERYIAIPSQAVAYKIGALTIQRLKKEAQAELGDRFDPREFHDQILNTGALPMSVLEAKIKDWVESVKTS